MKIAVLGTRGFPGVQGGVETHCQNLYPYLVSKGHDVTVFVRKHYMIHDLKSYKGVTLNSIDCPRNKYLEAIVHTFKGILRARKLKPDILHIHAIGPSLFAPLSRLMGMKVIITTQGSDYQRKKWPILAKKFLMFCEWMGMHFSNRIIAVTSGISNDIMRNYGKTAAVIPNGVDIPKIAETVDVLRRYELREHGYILSVGRLVPEKGFHDLIDAFSRMQAENIRQTSINSELKNLNLVIVGSADHKDAYSCTLKAKAQKNSNIILTGFLTGQPLCELFSYARLFVIPSYHEGLPLVFLEALSFGLSCIASDIPGNRALGVSDDRYFNAGNVGNITNKMEEFIGKSFSDTEQRMQIAMIEKKFNWERIADETLDVYQSIVASEKRVQ